MKLLECVRFSSHLESVKIGIDWYISSDEISQMSKRNSYRKRIGFSELPLPTHRVLTVTFVILSTTYIVSVRLRKLS